LRGDHGPACADIGLGASVGCRGLLELLPCACVGLFQRFLPFLLLTGFDLLSLRGRLLCLALRDGGVLQLDLVGEIVEDRLGGGDAGFSLSHLGFVISRIDLNQEIAGLDALEILHRDGQDLASDPAAQPGQLGFDVSVVGSLDHGVADPFIPAQRRQRDESKRGQHGEQRNGQPG